MKFSFTRVADTGLVFSILVFLKGQKISPIPLQPQHIKVDVYYSLSNKTKIMNSFNIIM